VASELELRQAPELRFVYDDTLDRAMRIDETIEELRRTKRRTRKSESAARSRV